MLEFCGCRRGIARPRTSLDYWSSGTDLRDRGCAGGIEPALVGATGRVAEFRGLAVEVSVGAAHGLTASPSSVERDEGRIRPLNQKKYFWLMISGDLDTRIFV